MSFGTGSRFAAGRSQSAVGRSVRLGLPSGSVIDMSAEDRVTGEVAALTSKLHRMKHEGEPLGRTAPVQLLGERHRAQRHHAGQIGVSATPLGGPESGRHPREPSTAEVAHSMGLRWQERDSLGAENAVPSTSAAPHALGGVAVHRATSGQRPAFVQIHATAAHAPASFVDSTASAHSGVAAAAAPEPRLAGQLHPAPAAAAATAPAVEEGGGWGSGADSSDSEDSHVREKAMQAAVADLARREVRRQLQHLGIVPQPAVLAHAPSASPLQLAAAGLRGGDAGRVPPGPAQQPQSRAGRGPPLPAASPLRAGALIAADFSSPESAGSDGGSPPSGARDTDRRSRAAGGGAAPLPEARGPSASVPAAVTATSAVPAPPTPVSIERPASELNTDDGVRKIGSGDAPGAAAPSPRPSHRDSGSDGDYDDNGVAGEAAGDLLGAFRPGMSAQQRRLWVMTLGQARAQLLREGGDGADSEAAATSAIAAMRSPRHRGSGETGFEGRGGSADGVGQLLEPPDRRPSHADSMPRAAATPSAPRGAEAEQGSGAAAASARRLSPPAALVAALSSQVATMTAQLAQLYSEVSALRSAGAIAAVPAAAAAAAAGSPPSRAGASATPGSVAAVLQAATAARTDAASPLELPSLRPDAQAAPRSSPAAPNAADAFLLGESALVRRLVAKIDMLEAQMTEMRRGQQQVRFNAGDGGDTATDGDATETASDGARGFAAESAHAGALRRGSRPPRAPAASKAEAHRPAKAVKRSASTAMRARRGSGGDSSDSAVGSGTERGGSASESDGAWGLPQLRSGDSVPSRHPAADGGRASTSSASEQQPRVAGRPGSTPAAQGSTPSKRSGDSRAAGADPIEAVAAPQPRLDVAVALADYSGDPAQHQMSFSSGDSLAIAHRLPTGWWYAHLLHPEDLADSRQLTEDGREVLVAPTTSRLAAALIDRGEATARRAALATSGGGLRRHGRSPTDALDFSRQGYVPGDFVSLTGAQVEVEALPLPRTQGPEEAAAPRSSARRRGRGSGEEGGGRLESFSAAAAARRARRARGGHAADDIDDGGPDDDVPDAPSPVSPPRAVSPAPAVSSSNPLLLLQQQRPATSVVSVPEASDPPASSSDEHDSEQTTGHQIGSSPRITVDAPAPAVSSSGIDWESFRASVERSRAAVSAIASWGRPEGSPPRDPAAPLLGEARRASPVPAKVVAAAPAVDTAPIASAVEPSPRSTPPPPDDRASVGRATPRATPTSALRKAAASRDSSAAKRVAWRDVDSPRSSPVGGSVVTADYDDDEDEEDIPPPPPMTPSMLVGLTPRDHAGVRDAGVGGADVSPATQASSSVTGAAAPPVAAAGAAPPPPLVFLPLPLPPPTNFAPSPHALEPPQLVAVPIVPPREDKGDEAATGVSGRGVPAAPPQMLFRGGSFFPAGPGAGAGVGLRVPPYEHDERPVLSRVPSPSAHVTPPHPIPVSDRVVSGDKLHRASAAPPVHSAATWKWSLPFGRSSADTSVAPGPPPRILPVDPDAPQAPPVASQVRPQRPVLPMRPMPVAGAPISRGDGAAAPSWGGVGAPLPASQPAPFLRAPPPPQQQLSWTQYQYQAQVQMRPLVAPSTGAGPGGFVDPRGGWQQAPPRLFQQVPGYPGAAPSATLPRAALPGPALAPSFARGGGVPTQPLQMMQQPAGAAGAGAAPAAPPPLSAVAAVSGAVGGGAPPGRFSAALSSASDAMGLIQRMQERRGGVA